MSQGTQNNGSNSTLVKQTTDIKEIITNIVDSEKREIYYIEPELFDEERFVPYLLESENSISVVPLYLYSDGIKKNLNIKTQYSQFNYKNKCITIDTQDSNKNLQDVMHQIDKKIYKLLINSTSKMVKLLSTYKLYASVIGDDKQLLKSSICDIKIKLSSKYNNTKIVKYNSKTFIKLMEAKGNKISEYSTISGFSDVEFDKFMQAEFGYKSNRCYNYLAKYIVTPRVCIFKTKENNYVMFANMNIYEGEIKHSKTYVNSLIDKNEKTYVKDFNNTVCI